MKTSYAHLVANPGRGSKGAAVNIRLELKKHFPGCKFSVRARSYTAVDISWTDGPTDKMVNAIVAKFQHGHFDGMVDCYEYKHDEFTETYGSCNYVFTSRDFSAAHFHRCLDMMRTHYAGNMRDIPESAISFGKYNQGLLYNMSMNMDGPAHRDNVQDVLRGIMCRTASPGFSVKATISKAEKGFIMKYWDDFHGKMMEFIGKTQDECIKHLEWEFYAFI